jgi:L-alanine-DL-glutamate epimerase-like enolase superfamily enzyme
MNINQINPATLKITDMRFADIDGAPKRCTLMKLFTNQGLVGYGEVRDASSRTYAAMLKPRILGENPCNVEKIFRRIKQFGGDSRQAGGVCAVELACWDLCGKAWGLPVWQLLGGKWRAEIRCSCDGDSATDSRALVACERSGEVLGLNYDAASGVFRTIATLGGLFRPVSFLRKMVP